VIGLVGDRHTSTLVDGKPARQPTLIHL
jgi:hypothetical protein